MPFTVTLNQSDGLLALGYLMMGSDVQRKGVSVGCECPENSAANNFCPKCGKANMKSVLGPGFSTKSLGIRAGFEFCSRQCLCMPDGNVVVCVKQIQLPKPAQENSFTSSYQSGWACLGLADLAQLKQELRESVESLGYTWEDDKFAAYLYRSREFSSF